MPILQFNIRGRLILGFGVLCVLLAAVVGTTIVKVGSVSLATDRTVSLRVPTAVTAGVVIADIYASLASLRGWLITGNDAFKTERAGVWGDLQRNVSAMDRLAGSWPGEQDKQDWLRARPLLDELRDAQDKAEAIAHTIDDQPAAKFLATEANPLAREILKKVTSIIDEEAAISSDDARKSLLVGFADFRGSMAMAVGAVRAYLLTADPAIKAEFDELWAINQKKVDALVKRRSEMTPTQQAAFDALLEARAKFAPLPNKMFDIRASDRWNMAQWLLLSEAVPRANKLLDIFEGAKNGSGSRSGGMVSRQQESLKADGTETLAELGFLTKLLYVLLGAGIGVSAVIIYLTNRSIVPPIRSMVAAMGKLARGECSTVVPGVDRRDEIGEMAAGLEVFKQSIIDTARLRNEKEEDEQRRIRQRSAEMGKMADDFESTVGQIVEAISSASTELEASAGTLTATAARSHELSAVVAAASEEAATNVQSVASAAEELTSSVNEISRQVQESARVAMEAVTQAHQTNDRVGELSKAATRIGDVVELINTIAGQTNLLALNATIEAARAGEAGRGFAVVASEVKALAEQTAKATGEIGQQIDSIQAATQQSVEAIREISGTIEKLSEISAAIASAVEEQGAATQEISRNVQQAAHGTTGVSSNITDVQRGAGETGSASSQVLSAARSLSNDSSRLKLQVGNFLASVRSG
jgi:methyl-accepting chemotaxis protein